jgi:hypothetical protein
MLTLRRSRCAALLLVSLAAWCLLQCGAAGVEQQVLALDESTGGPGVRTLRVGEKVALDELGPVVVNPDCTLRHIVRVPRA